MLVMVAYVSLSPARYEIFAGPVDCDASLGEAAYFGKTFGCLYGFFETHGDICKIFWSTFRWLMIYKIAV
jgi:hypothetical protein